MAEILIDGYNLMRCSKNLGRYESISLEKGREALVVKLAPFASANGHRITVVFDAAGGEESFVTEQRVMGVRVLFTRRGESADALIALLARKNPGKWIVVSSDNEVKRSTSSAGCGVLTSEEFERKMNASPSGDGNRTSDDEARQPVHKRWITKKKGPSRRLPKEKRRALARLRGL